MPSGKERGLLSQTAAGYRALRAWAECQQSTGINQVLAKCRLSIV